MNASTLRTYRLARLAVVCFFALTIVFVTSSSRPWAASNVTPIGLADDEVTSQDLNNSRTLPALATVEGAFSLNRLNLANSTSVGVPSLVDVFNKNQRLLMNQSPAIITPTYATGPSFTGTIPVGSPVHLVYSISVPTGDPNPIQLTITKPTGFTPTLLRAINFPGGTGSGNPLPLSVTSLPTFSIGPLSGSFDIVVVVIDGFFTQAGSVFATFSPTRNAITEPTSLTMDAGVVNLPVDISVTKVVKPKTGGTFASTATVPFGGAVTYKLTIKNESAPDPDHKTDVYLGTLLKLHDSLSTSGNDVNLSISASNFLCTPSSLTDCPSVPAATSFTLGTNNSQVLTFSYPASSSGFLPAQGSFEITFDAVITTGAQCSPGQNNKLLNMGFFTYSNGATTVSDQNPANNTTLPASPTTVTLTGLPATGCTVTPSITVDKKLLSPAAGAWGVPFRYLITITNTSGQALSGLKLWDYVYGSSTPPFTATFAPTASNFICSPACSAIPAAASPLVVPNPQYLFQNLALASPLASGAVQTVQFDVQYDTPCASDTVAGSITNNVFLTGPATGSDSETTNMPALSVCQLETTKVQTSGPTSITSFPATLGYKVQFKNNSNQTIRVGTLIDAMALDSPGYGNVPVDYSYTCTPTSVTLQTGPVLSKPPGTLATIQFNSPLWAGVRLIDLSSATGAVFSPGGDITCNLSVTLKQPPPDDSLCQGAGTPKVVNSSFMALPHAFNTNQTQQPVYYQSVTTPLPKCVSIIAGKTVAPNVFAGGAVTFTLTVKNVGNDPVSNITLTDNVPLDFTNVMWTCASGCSSGGSSTPGNNISIPLNTIAAGATVTVVVTATAPTILGSYCNPAQATFNPFPAATFFEGDQNALTNASACVQVKSPETTTTTPTLTKSFEAATIGANSTSTLAFTITNGTGDPKQTGISFSDTLPAGLQIVSVLTNGCSGTPSISTDGRTITLTGGQLVGSNADGSGKHSCQIIVRVKASDTCGVYRNDKTNFSHVENLDVTNAQATLTVTGCTTPTECGVKTNEISCKSDGTGGYLFTFTVINNTGQVVTDILLTPPANSGITLSDTQFHLSPGLANGATHTLQVTIKGGHAGQEACFYVTLMTKEGECCTTRVCPVLPECCGTVRDESIECNNDGSYTYTLSIVNTGSDTIEHIYLYPPAGVTMTPNYFAVSLKPGDTFTGKVTITGAKPGDKLCFDISLHSANMEKCCKGQHCIVLPECRLSNPR
jgi:uncharacterized repeat protein (TIGR01451 family)